MKESLVSFFFFAEKIVTTNMYLDMSQLYDVPQLPDKTIYQQDGALPHFSSIVRTFLYLVSRTGDIGSIAISIG